MKNTLRTTLAGLGITASLLVGAGGIASAQDATSPSAPTTKTAATTKAAPKTEAGGQTRGQRMQDVLAPLVTSGTLTQSQSDAVIKAFQDHAATERAAGRGGRNGGRGRGQGKHRAAIATALGITETELMAAHQAGKTVAQLATEKGVDINKVIESLVAAEKAEHPDRTEAEIRQHVTNMVNGVKPNR
jgi:hypothetical protein